MRRLLLGVLLLAMAAQVTAIRNGCIPGTNGCSECQHDPHCSQLSTLSGHCDFDANSQSDLLWWNPSTARARAWLMNGKDLIGAPTLLNPPRVAADPNWMIGATGYFNEDDRTDVLWQNVATGEMRLWLMGGIDGLTRQEEIVLQCPASVVPCTPPSPSWRVVASGFFGIPPWQIRPTVDGKSDIVFRHQGNGNVMIWIMDGPAVTKQVTLGANPTSQSPLWKIEGAGFFDAGTSDPYTDLVWYNRQNGQLRLWRMQDFLSYAEVAFPDTEPDTKWKLVGTGEFNAAYPYPQFPDLVWRHEHTGAVRIWFMQGTTRLGVLSTTPDGIAESPWRPFPK